MTTTIEETQNIKNPTEVICTDLKCFIDLINDYIWKTNKEIVITKYNDKNNCSDSFKRNNNIYLVKVHCFIQKLQPDISIKMCLVDQW